MSTNKKLKPPIDVQVLIRTRSMSMEAFVRIVGHQLTAKEAEALVRKELVRARLHAVDPELEG
jgi:hypothetical protein